MKLPDRLLIAAAVCCFLCVLLSTAGIVANQIAFSRIDPNNRLILSQDVFHTFASWSFLFYDLLHVFVIVVFALAWPKHSVGKHGWVEAPPLFHLWQTSHP